MVDGAFFPVLMLCVLDPCIGWLSLFNSSPGIVISLAATGLQSLLPAEPELGMPGQIKELGG